MSNKFYVDKVLYKDYLDIIKKIITNENLDIYFFLLHNKCITITKKIKKILVPYYYYKNCSKNMNILNIKYLMTHDRTFMLISYKNKIDEYYYLNLFCDTFNLLTFNQKSKSTAVNTYKNLLNKLRKNPNSGGYIIKNEYDNLPNNIKKNLHGKYPVILTLQ